MRAAFSNIPRCYQRNAHEPVPNHERVCHPLLFGECQVFLCKPTEDVAVKCGVIRDPQVVEGGKQQRRIVERLAASFPLFDLQGRRRLLPVECSNRSQQLAAMPERLYAKLLEVFRREVGQDRFIYLISASYFPRPKLLSQTTMSMTPPSTPGAACLHATAPDQRNEIAPSHSPTKAEGISGGP